MLAYRHAFHAGNHADVLKHLVFTQVLRYLGQKDKPYWLIDTHAGAGGYDLRARHAQQHAEYLEGIGRLVLRDDLPPAVDDYVQIVRQHNPDGVLRHYPGSPAFARAVMRPQDRLRLYELHPTDHRQLLRRFGAQPHVEVHVADGFAALRSQWPPPSRRGVVLMDPPYELKADYGRVVATLREAVQRFAEGVYMVWYPQLQRLESQQLPQRLKRLAPKGWLHVRMTVARPAQAGFGLLGSGMFVINPPWVLHDTLAAVLPWLTEVLAQYEGASYLLEQHAV
ncbi:MAG: ribosomal RNA large subunit methyltransferase J [Caldimonas sp.]|uniref:23S rRNA (adenine(2030)-N(6))-methyltransferase RlmJ n=1 Tax=Caldimonas taiwanensis TaxID=307483 RepID=UPI000781DC7C|nr:23S rRNA (adenine(2030)-N(6))-methyltransferase RlmJ [Caldimonas taiwanensis]GIX24722.1 MAG: ribosomal RNA large subunit methyltransferase J [Caldimonas sp.]